MPTTNEILTEALDFSADAAFAALDRLGGDRGDCGGAWVVLTARKGRKALVSALTARNISTSPHYAGGVAIYILRNFPAQSRLCFEKGCDEFVRVLRENGFDAFTYSYAD